MEQLVSKPALLDPQNPRYVEENAKLPFTTSEMGLAIFPFSVLSLGESSPRAFLHLCVLTDSYLFVFTIQVTLGTKVGRAKHMRIMPGGALEADQELGGPSSVFVGRKLDDHRGAFYLEHPMDKGAVTENGWDAMERLWEVRTT